MSENTLRQLQAGQPWTVPYSTGLLSAVESVPYLLSSHVVLHAAKSVGKLAAVFEDADHGEPVDKDMVASMAADLVTAAMRLANLHGFDLQGVLEARVLEKNGVGFSNPLGPDHPLCQSH